MQYRNVDSSWRPSDKEHLFVQKLAALKKNMYALLLENQALQLKDLNDWEMVDGLAGLYVPARGLFGAGYMTPELYLACVSASGFDSARKDIDPYLEDFCSIYNYWMDALEITPNPDWLAAELAQLTREVGLRLKPLAENGGRAYTEDQQKKIGGVNMSYWRASSNGKSYYARGLGSMTFDYNYKAYQDWCVQEGKPWRPYDDPDVLLDDLECSVTSLIFLKYIRGGARGKPDLVIQAHLNARQPEAFYETVVSCAGATAMARREAEGNTRKYFETYLPIAEEILGTQDPGQFSPGSQTYLSGHTASWRSGGEIYQAPPAVIPPYIANGRANWPRLNIDRIQQAIRAGNILRHDKGTICLGAKSHGQCSGGVCRMIAYGSGVTNFNSYRGRAAWQYCDCDGAFFKSGNISLTGTIPGVAGHWEMVDQCSNAGCSSSYKPQPGDLGCGYNQKSGSHGFHLEMYLGPGCGRSGWWSDFDQGGPLKYVHKEIWRRMGD